MTLAGREQARRTGARHHHVRRQAGSTGQIVDAWSDGADGQPVDAFEVSGSRVKTVRRRLRRSSSGIGGSAATIAS
jgi:hypothetical protein